VVVAVVVAVVLLRQGVREVAPVAALILLQKEVRQVLPEEGEEPSGAGVAVPREDEAEAEGEQTPIRCRWRALASVERQGRLEGRTVKTARQTASGSL